MKKLHIILGITAATMIISSASSVNAFAKLTDISNTKYEKAVMELMNRHIVNGFPDETYRPDENVTRAQMAKMIVEGKNLKNNGRDINSAFSDLSNEHWAYSYIQTAVENNMIIGYPDGTFEPEKNVTYAEAIAMILRAMNVENSMKDKSWPTAYITEATKQGLLKDIEYTSANDNATRGNIALALYRMLQKEDEKISTKTEDNKKSGFRFISNQLGDVDIVEINGQEYEYKTNSKTQDINVLDYQNGVILFSRETKKDKEYVIFKSGITLTDLKDIDNKATDYIEAISDKIVLFENEGTVIINDNFKKQHEDYTFVNVQVNDDMTSKDDEIVLSIETPIKAKDVTVTNFEEFDRIVEDKENKVMFIIRGLEERSN